MFFHEASKEEGSSGSPIVLKNDDKVLGIHKGAIPGKKKNVGIFIRIVMESLKEYKKNGEGKDYYEDGKIKYEGKFEDDEYNDNKGKFYDENGNKYEGQFTKGKKNGEFSVYDKDGKLIKTIKYENDKLIKENIINNNTNENIIVNKDTLHTLLGSLYEIYKPIGDKFLDICFCDCGHNSEYHTQVKPGDYRYKCSKCPEGKDLCELKRI